MSELIVTDSASVRWTATLRQVMESPRFVGWRVLHMREGGYPNPEGMPCVRPSYDGQPVNFTEGLQVKSYELNAGNPNLTKPKWRVVYGNSTAFTNGQGFDKAGDPRRDYVNHLNLTATFADGTPALPRLMKGIICGGMFIRGVVEGNYLVCTPGVHAIDGNAAVPTVSEIIARQWYFTATTGGWERVSNFPQGGGMPVLIPFILREVTRYPMSGTQDGKAYVNFERWDADVLPSPLTFYHPK